jgi:hypothetical protein
MKSYSEVEFTDVFKLVAKFDLSDYIRIGIYCDFLYKNTFYLSFFGTFGGVLAIISAIRQPSENLILTILLILEKFVSFVLLGILATIVSTIYRAYAKFNRNRNYIETVSVNPIRITNSIGASNSFQYWRDIKEIGVFDKYIHIISKSRFRLFIPRKSFSSPQEENEFLEFVNNMISLSAKH